MREIIRFALLLAVGLTIFAGCNKDDDDAAKQAGLDEQIIVDYLTNNGIDAQRHESGLYYKITKEGTGAQPDFNSVVGVFYKGYLVNGTVFDQTTHGSVLLPLSNLIDGWKIGVPMLKSGGSGTFFIPSALGYGNQPAGAIPANSVLIFEIDLVSVQ